MNCVNLPTAAGDKVSLAIGMAGRVSALIVHGRFARSIALGLRTHSAAGVDRRPDVDTRAVYAADRAPRLQTGELAEVLRLAQRIIDLADGDPAKGNLIIGSPLAWRYASRGCARFCLGDPGWRDDIDQAVDDGPRDSTRRCRAVIAAVQVRSRDPERGAVAGCGGPARNG